MSCDAIACSCSFAPLGTQEAQSARNIFVFQLTDAHVEHSAPNGYGTWVVGTIKVLDQVRGTTKARQVRYSTYMCCGSRLEVGKYYIAFLASDASRFDGNAGNLLPLWGGFDQKEAASLNAVLHGTKDLEDVFPFGLKEIQQVRPPPPPCPSQGKTNR